MADPLDTKCEIEGCDLFGIVVEADHTRLCLHHTYLRHRELARAPMEMPERTVSLRNMSPRAEMARAAVEIVRELRGHDYPELNHKE